MISCFIISTKQDGVKTITTRSKRDITEGKEAANKGEDTAGSDVDTT